MSTALGQFVDAVDQALISGEVDLAVHSMKDVPVEHMQGIELVSVLPRFPVEDLLLHQGEGQTLAEVLSQRGDGTVLSMSASEVFSGFPSEQNLVLWLLEGKHLHFHLGQISNRFLCVERSRLAYCA